MSKTFRINSALYLSTDLGLCSLAAQGLFINMSVLYSNRNGELTSEQVMKAKEGSWTYLDELVKCGAISIDKGTDSIHIPMIDNQMKKPKPKMSIADAKKKFGENVAKYIKKYDKDMCRAFFDYWTEQNEEGSMMRFQKEKTFGMGHRLSTWKGNEKKFSGKGANEADRSIKIKL